MKMHIKMLLGILSISLLVIGCNQHKSSENNDIQNQVSYWQQKNLDKSNSSKYFYHMYYGDNFENNKWVNDNPNDEDYFIGETVVFWSNDEKGIFFEMQRSSPSGDWAIISKHYYDKNKKLIFVSWKLNTTQTQSGPLTIERKLYFNKSGNLKQKLESVYKMDSRDTVKDANYLEQDLQYWINIDAVPFKHLVNLNK